MNRRKLKSVIFFALILILYLYPLLFGYKDWFWIHLKVIFLWVVCLVSAIIFVGLSTPSPWKYVRLFLSAFFLIMFWIVKGHLLSKSEEVYFHTHKAVFNRIHQTDLESDSSRHIQTINHEEYFYNDYIVFKTGAVTAIGVTSILDNTDGFLYWNEIDSLPTGFFGGNLTFTEKIDGKWYKFSTR